LRHRGIAGFVVEARNGNDLRSGTRVPSRHPVRRHKQDEEKGSSNNAYPLCKPPSSLGTNCLVPEYVTRDGSLDGCDELVTALGNRADISRLDGRIVEGSPDLGNAEIQATLEINEGTVRPDGLAQFFPRDDIAGTLKQTGQCLSRLGLQANQHAVSA